MNNLATKNTQDFTVSKSGEAFISQRKAAALCGVSHTTVQNWIEVATLKVNENKQLDADSLLEVATKAAGLGKQEVVIGVN